MRHWDGGLHRLEELQVLGEEVETDYRTQMWLGEADEFGVLLMSGGICMESRCTNPANTSSKCYPLKNH